MNEKEMILNAMTIREKVIDAINFFVKENGYETWISGAEIKDYVNSCYINDSLINPKSFFNQQIIAIIAIITN